MKKRWISLLLALAMVAAMVPQVAIEARAVQSGTCGNNLTWTLDDEGTLTISGTGAMYDYSWDGNKRIPWMDNRSDIETLIISDGVTSIGAEAFSYCENLKTVAIADTVSSIGEFAFGSCTSLSSIIIPRNVVDLHLGIFSYCSSLTNITVADTNTSYTSIDGVVFSKDMTELLIYPNGREGSYAIPSGTNIVRDHAFQACQGLTAITFPDSVTEIGEHAFDQCYYLSDIALPRNLISVGSYAFSECMSLSSEGIPDSITYFGDYAFSYCKMNGKLHISENVTYIGINAFGACNLEEIHVAAGNPYYASDNGILFSKDLSILHLYPSAMKNRLYIVPQNVSVIFRGAFNGVQELTALYLPLNTVSIQAGAFNYTPNLTDVFYEGTEAQWALVDIGVWNSSLTNATIHFEAEIPSVPIGPTKPEVPSGYAFSEDSYQFDNSAASGKIDKKYYTTLYEPAAGKLFYEQNKELGENGVCFGIAYTTAAIYNEFPSADSFITRHYFTEDKPCRIIRDLELKSKFELISNEFESKEISLLDYLRYAHIYQFSSTVQNHRNQTQQQVNELLEQVRTTLASDKIGVAIDMFHFVMNNGVWENDYGHTVLAVGIDGNDILIDDPNNTETVERLTLRRDGSWSFSGYGSFSFSGSWDDGSTENSVLCYNTDVTIPYQLLYTGTHATPEAAEHPIVVMDDEDEFVDTYVEGMQCVDSNKMLLCIESDEYQLNNTDALPIMWSDLVEDADMFWVNDTSSVVLSDIVGSDTAVHLASDDLLLGIETTGDADISMTNDGTYSSVTLDTMAGTVCTLSLETTGTNEQDVLLTISGTAYNGSVTMEQTNSNIDITGLNDGIITLTENNEIIAEKPIPGSNEEIRVEYDPTGNDDDVEISFTNPFTDVPEGVFYYIPVLWAVENGITTGATETTFNPTGDCLRAQVVTFLWRAAGEPKPTSIHNPFEDVKPSDFYYDAVLWAVENGITNGADATHFNPMGVCNRAQVVTFLYRAFHSPDVENESNPFTDVPAGTWYADPVLWAVENGITNGLSATEFGPNANCNRAQIVTFLYRAYN